MLTSYEFITGYMRSKFGNNERGAALVEYALLLALIAVVCIAALTLLGEGSADKFSVIESEISGAGS